MDTTDQRLIMGLKAGLVEAHTFVLSKCSKDQEHQDEIRKIKEKYNKELQQKQNEIEKLKKDLDELNHRKARLSFNANKFQALSEEKIKEMEKLKSESTKVANI